MKFAAAMPSANNSNGLEDLVDRLNRQPSSAIVCVVIVDASQITTDIDKHTVTPTVRVRHIEPMLSPNGHRDATRLLERAYRERTSEQMELPLFDLDSLTGHPVANRIVDQRARGVFSDEDHQILDGQRAVDSDEDGEDL